MLRVAYVFPGQGSQVLGMAKDFHNEFKVSRLAFEEASDATKINIKKLCFDGPMDELTLTENLQPCLLTASTAMYRALDSENQTQAALFAGHSLGEYSALVAAGSLSLFQAAQLTKKRGESMQKAVAPGQGAMAAVLGPDFNQVLELCTRAQKETGEVVAVANDNAPGQIVISGTARAVDAAQRILSSDVGFGRAKFIALNVSAPFHCPLMQAAQDLMRPMLLGTAFKRPSAPVLCNVTAKPVTDHTPWPALLLDQITGTVRWRESMESLPALLVDRLVEVGPGQVLTGLMKRINRGFACGNINSVESMKSTIKELS